MVKKKVARLLRRFGNLRLHEKRIVGRFLRRLPDSLKLNALQGIFPVYVGVAHPLRGQGWAIFMDWNILNGHMLVRGRRKRELARKSALGALALNFGHFALRHGPKVIHTGKAYHKARERALEWGFQKEILAMEAAYLE